RPVAGHLDSRKSRTSRGVALPLPRDRWDRLALVHEPRGAYLDQQAPAGGYLLPDRLHPQPAARLRAVEVARTQWRSPFARTAGGVHAGRSAQALAPRRARDGARLA